MESQSDAAWVPCLLTLLRFLNSPRFFKKIMVSASAAIKMVRRARGSERE